MVGLLSRAARALNVECDERNGEERRAGSEIERCALY
jgi:hypothetical protein